MNVSVYYSRKMLVKGSYIDQTFLCKHNITLYKVFIICNNALETSREVE